MPRMFRSGLLSFVTFGGLLLAGPAGAIDVCGNGVCATNAIPPENATNCPDDCGAGPVDDCPDDSCENGSCSRPAASTDNDDDGVPDRLEYDLAHKFFPSVLLQWHGEDRSESYLYNDRSAPYTLRPYASSAGSLCNASFECLEIRWGIPFFRDHGDTFLDLGDHQGDSEMYAALLRRKTTWSGARTDAASWEMIRDFTSAHSGGRVGSYGCQSCSVHHSDPAACNARPICSASAPCIGHNACGRVTTQRACTARGCTWNPMCSPTSAWSCYSSTPLDANTTVYCAESKHALYHTDGECDSGAILNADDCPNNQYDMRDWKSGLLQNVGNADAHRGFDTTIQDPSHCGPSDVWMDQSFGETTPYKDKFTTQLNWALE